MDEPTMRPLAAFVRAAASRYGSAQVEDCAQRNVDDPLLGGTEMADRVAEAAGVDSPCCS